jgi:hypothetical protein
MFSLADLKAFDALCLGALDELIQRLMGVQGDGLSLCGGKSGE